MKKNNTFSFFLTFFLLGTLGFTHTSYGDQITTGHFTVLDSTTEASSNISSAGNSSTETSAMEETVSMDPQTSMKKEKKTTKKLPPTGETNNFLFIFGFIDLIICRGLLYLILKKRMKEMKRQLLLTGLAIVAMNTIGTTTSFATTTPSTTKGVLTFNQGTLSLEPTQIPTDLNFGSSAISYKSDMTQMATTDGGQDSNPITGKMHIEDLRGTAAGWTLKVNQSQFKNSANAELTGTQLSLTTGQVTNVGGTAPSEGKINQKVALNPGTDTELLKANQAEGNGVSELPISRFEIKIPASAAKITGEYSSTITWTLSDTI